MPDPTDGMEPLPDIEAPSPAWDAMSAAVDSAAPATPQAPGQGQPVQKVGASVSYKGLPAGVNAPKDYAGAKAEARADASGQEPSRQQQLAALDTDYRAMGEAAQKEADANSAHFELTKALLHDKETFQRAQYAMEQKAQAESHAVATKLLSGYQEQLAGVRALAAQSGNPIDGISKGQGVGLVGAMFAQGFLAARGIHIDVAGQIDRWVERGIQQHQQQIQNARESAGDTLHLYEIARQTSNDEYEARQRYRGMVLEGFQTSLEMEAARSGSQIAQARAQGIIAKAQLEKHQTQSALYDRWQQRDFNDKKLLIDQIHLQHQDQNESMRSQADLLRAKADANKNQKSAAGVFFSDNSQVQKDPTTGAAISGGKFLWGVRSEATNLPKEAISTGLKEAHTATTARDDLRDAAQRLRELRSQVQNMGGPEMLKKYPERYRRYAQQKSLISASLKRGMEGLKGSDADQKLYENVLADDSWLQKGSNASLIDNLDEWSREHYAHEMNANPVLYKVGTPGTEAPAKPYDEKVTVDPGTAALGNQVVNPEKQITSQAEQQEGIAVSPNRRDTDTKQFQVGKASSAFVQYLRETGKNPAESPDDFLRKNGQRREYAAVDKLATGSVHPEKLAADHVIVNDDGKMIDSWKEDPGELSQQSLHALRNLSMGRTSSGEHVADEVRDYARWMLSKVEEQQKMPFGNTRNREQLDRDPFIQSLDPSVEYRLVGY